MFLVDTNVISVAARRNCDDDVLPLLDWLDRNGAPRCFKWVGVCFSE